MREETAFAEVEDEKRRYVCDGSSASSVAGPCGREETTVAAAEDESDQTLPASPVGPAVQEMQAAAARSNADAVNYRAEKCQHGIEEQAEAACSGAGSGCREASVEEQTSLSTGQVDVERNIHDWVHRSRQKLWLTTYGLESEYTEPQLQQHLKHQ